MRAIDRALAEQRYETARRLCLADGNRDGANPAERFERVCRLHEAYRRLGDFRRGAEALSQIVPADRNQELITRLRLAEDYTRLSLFDCYRSSAECRQGLSVDEYSAKMLALAGQHFNQAAPIAETVEQKRLLAESLRRCGREAEAERIAPPAAARLAPTDVPPPPAAGSIEGSLLNPHRRPMAGVGITLGLRVKAPVNPDPATYGVPEMHYIPDLGEQSVRTTTTDRDGRFRFDDVPAGEHEFIAATFGPETPGVRTQFLAHNPIVRSGERTSCTLIAADWHSAEPLPSPHRFEPTLRLDGAGGVEYTLVSQHRLANPFYFEFPRQLLKLPLPSDSDAPLVVVRSTAPRTPIGHQLIDDSVAVMTDLPPCSDQAIAIYAAATSSIERPASGVTLTPDAGGQTAVLDTGVAQFRIPYGNPDHSLPPLLGVRGVDSIWRGQGRWKFGPGQAIAAIHVGVLCEGPLVARTEIQYTLQNGHHYRFGFEAHAGEPYLLVHEIAPDGSDVAFEFSLREFSGGRGFLHWNAESGSLHWSSLTAESRELARLQESVPWWISPAGFGYAMTADGLQQQDYIGVFTLRRGEWIDRAFERLASGPGDEPAWRRELDWPFPEMVGSTVSMITAHTDPDADAYFRFPAFDGERHWGLLVSTLDANDGPYKAISSVQHKNSSPTLQQLRTWHLDAPDPTPRPNHVIRADRLADLRANLDAPHLRPVWQRVIDGSSRGATHALQFAVEGDPLVAWRKKKELVGVAHFRARMTLLGREFGDMYSPVGARPITHWAEDFDLIAGSGAFTPDEERLVRAFLLLMGNLYLSTDLMNWKLGSRNANFEADRVDVVGSVGLVFDSNPAGRRMIEHVIDQTRASLRTYCTPGSGKWYENPACYYLQAGKCRINLIAHLARRGLIEVDRIERLREFLGWGLLLLTPPAPADYNELTQPLSDERYHQTHRIRRIAPIGDHARAGAHVSDHFAIAAMLFRDTDRSFSDHLLWAWQNGGMGGEPFGNVPLLLSMLNDLGPPPAAPQPPNLESRRLEGFGAVGRYRFGQPDEGFLLIKQGPGGYRYHRSEGSILYFEDGKPLIYDGGEAGETWRHTTLSFFDSHMPMSAGHVERFVSNDEVDFCQGVHPVVIRPGEPVFLSDDCHHRLVAVALERFAKIDPAVVRTTVWVKGQYLILRDDLRLDPGTPHYWHLQAVADSHTVDPGYGYRFAGRFGTDLQVLLPGQTFSTEKIEQVPTLEYKLPANQCFSMRHLQLKGVSNHYTAMLRPLSPHRPPLEAALLPNGDQSAGIRVTGPSIDDTHIFQLHSTPLATPDLRFTGRYASLLRRRDSVRVQIIDGESLETNDLRLTLHQGAITLDLTSTGPIIAQGEGIFRLEWKGQHVESRLTAADGHKVIA